MDKCLCAPEDYVVIVDMFKQICVSDWSMFNPRPMVTRHARLHTSCTLCSSQREHSYCALVCRGGFRVFKIVYRCHGPGKTTNTG